MNVGVKSCSAATQLDCCTAGGSHPIKKTWGAVGCSHSGFLCESGRKCPSFEISSRESWQEVCSLFQYNAEAGAVGQVHSGLEARVWQWSFWDRKKLDTNIFLKNP